MEISDAVGVGLVNLPEAFIFDGLLNSLAVNLGVKCQLDRVNDILIELVKSYFSPVSLYGLFDMFVDIFVRNKTEIVVVWNSWHLSVLASFRRKVTKKTIYPVYIFRILSTCSIRRINRCRTTALRQNTGVLTQRLLCSSVWHGSRRSYAGRGIRVRIF